MAVRRESVVLDLDDRLTPGLIRAAAAAGVLDRELNKLDGQSTRTSRGLASTEAEVKNLDRTAGGSTKTIDRYSGRIGLLGDALLTLGPAAVTVGATAVPVVAALSSELGFAAVGAGTAMLAFKDLGPALTAFNKAAAAPTATNIAAAQTAMDKIPPSAQRFVLELHRLNPEMAKLREAAGAGLFEGLTSGIHAAERDLPIARQALRGVSMEMGHLADEAGHALASDQWRPFLRFVGAEAPHALDDMGRAAGSVAHGLAGLWMAFGQENRILSAGIVGLAHDFDMWANSVGRTKGFQDFLAYVNANGPRVMDLLGQVGITLVDIGTAAAPIGGPVLDVLTSLFQIIDAIAKSDFGTPLLAGLLAFRLYARAAQLMGAEVEMSFKGIAAAPKQVSDGLAGLQAKTAAWSRATVADVGIVTRALMTAGAMSEREAALQGGAMTRLRGTAGTAIKGGAAAAGIALVASGLPDKLGASNTASLALMGTLAGPLGTALGAAAGLTLDLSHANDSLVNSQKQADAALRGTDYAAAAAAVSDLSSETSNYLDLLHTATDPGSIGSVKATFAAISDAFTHQSAESTAALHDAIAKQFDTQTALQDIGRGLGAPDMQFGTSFAANSADGIQRLTEIAQRAQPAMDALHISFEDLQSAAAANDGSFTTLTGRIVKWINNADSAAGASRAVAAAFAHMGDQSMTLDDRVSALSDSLDGLIDPMMNFGQAKDAFHQGLNDIKQSLAQGSRALKGNSDAAIQNRNAIRTQVSSLKAMLQAQAQVDPSSKHLSASLRDGRKAIIDSARAAGLNAGQVQHMIDVMGLTPKQIKTLITVNASQAIAEARAVAAALAAIRDKTVRITTVHTTGGHSVGGNADGGFIQGPGGPRDDVIPAWLSNGEFVVNAAATARNLSLLHSINAQKFADGGQATSTTTSSSNPHPTPAERAQARADAAHVKHFQHALDEATKSLDKERALRDSIRQAEQQQMATVRDSFRSDFLGVNAGAWSTSDPMGILRGDIAGARRYRHDIRDLRGRHISTGLAAQITTLAQADQVDAMSNRQLHQLEHLFRVRQRLSASAGRTDATVVYGEKLTEANHHLAHLRGDVHQLTAEVKHLKAEQAKHAKKTGDAVAAGVNNGVRNGVRRVRHK